MKVEIHIHVHAPEPDQTIEAGPLGTDALVEHGNHDSTPRKLGFNPDHMKEEDE